MSGSVVTATSDNAEEVYFNGVMIGSDGEVQGPFVDNHEWNTLKDYSFDPVAGTNTLDFIVRNYAYPTDSPTVNPTGLLYKVEVDYLTRCETAWGAGIDFSGKNWATYFAYSVQHVWQLLETIKVPAISTTVYSINTLEDGKQYKIVASGTAYAGGKWTTDIEFDAEYSYTWSDDPTVWVDGVAHYESWGPDLLDLKVEGAFIDWGPFNEAHVYEHILTGTDSTLTLELFIWDFYPSNNKGSLTVQIFILIF